MYVCVGVSYTVTSPEFTSANVIYEEKFQYTSDVEPALLEKRKYFERVHVETPAFVHPIGNMFKTSQIHRFSRPHGIQQIFSFNNSL